MKKSKIPPKISLEYLLNEVKKQEQREKKILYISSDTEIVLQIKNKDI